MQPLRATLDRVGELAQLVEGFKLEPSETELRGLCKELARFKSRIQSLAKLPMASDNPALAGEAHELDGEANNIITRGQRQIQKLLRRRGMIQEGYEISSIAPVAGALGPRLVVVAREGKNSSFRWKSGGDCEQRGRENPRTSGRGEREDLSARGSVGLTHEESNLAALLSNLGEAQANDAGWPIFKGKYMEYPRSKKEWWAYRMTYHTYVRDELVCRILKENA